jgi:hypothetical protein
VSRLGDYFSKKSIVPVIGFRRRRRKGFSKNKPEILLGFWAFGLLGFWAFGILAPN